MIARYNVARMRNEKSLATVWNVQLVQFISMLDAFARKTHLKPRGSALIE